MILIADSGSTQTTWCLINVANHKTLFYSEGYNPFYIDSNYIIQSLNGSLPNNIDGEEVSAIHFYGAGCVPEKANVIEEAMSTLFPKANVYTETDILAAARALLGNKSGFAAILGTGMNSCFYDGGKIIHQISPLGYMLGDEGSGNYIGKKLLVDFIRGDMPKDLYQKFAEDYRLTPSEIMERVYRQAYPNRFCAGFTKFLYKNIQHPYSSAIIKTSFIDFVRIINSYPNSKAYSLNCIGSVAYYFNDILSEVAREFNMGIGVIIRDPIHALAKYHLSRN